MRTILVVDDSFDMRQLCLRALQHHDTQILTAATAEEAVYLLETNPIDVMVIDYMLPPSALQFQKTTRRSRVMNGVGLMQEAVARRPQLPVMFISAQDPKVLRMRGVPTHVPIIQKPFRGEVLQDAIHHLFDKMPESGAVASDQKVNSTISLIPRKHRRFLLSCPIRFEGDASGTGRTQDVSLGGCKIQSEVLVRPQHHLTLICSLPSLGTLKINVAVVRWAVRGVFGVQFLWIESSAESQLKEYLGRLGANDQVT